MRLAVKVVLNDLGQVIGQTEEKKAGLHLPVMEDSELVRSSL